ncbi:hypothetical protein C8E95_4429 [Pseudonocardia autotrophica]|uniref:Uncharacterized protein n=3 Tax=Pseudonocardiaceae TaxID=2070 RepID=A0A1Y2MWE3_PSEAH|nr:hypothetical protein BG845_03428 [Pseudonocardia autotrophica]TDN75280.1 hypothetical protein C8E95_4429 [Pseudonocardia autotrophica]BBF99226.1 hypothetical protein Pdca_04360 [Pseudonocardia autotrophica]GEC24772.1 hypothetical protein PSA01_18010 [Pseudonocardia saturnea]
MLLAGMLVTATACGVPAAGAGPAGPTIVATAGADGMTPVRFEHRSGEPVEAVPTVIVPRGTTLVLTVGSDVARRVLIPEQGRAVDVTAGGTVTVRFIALGTLSVRVTEPGADDGGTVIGRVQPRH